MCMCDADISHKGNLLKVFECEYSSVVLFVDELKLTLFNFSKTDSFHTFQKFQVYSFFSYIYMYFILTVDFLEATCFLVLFFGRSS